MLAAIVWSFAVSGALFLLFCWLRPRNSTVYARRAKHADEKHAPLHLDRKPFAWLRAIKDVKEQELVEKIGLDAVIFLRFLRMLRNMFIVLSVFGCGILIPVNVVGGSSFYEQWDNIATLMKVIAAYLPLSPKLSPLTQSVHTPIHLWREVLGICGLRISFSGHSLLLYLVEL